MACHVILCRIPELHPTYCTGNYRWMAESPLVAHRCWRLEKNCRSAMVFDCSSLRSSISVLYTHINFIDQSYRKYHSILKGMATPPSAISLINTEPGTDGNGVTLWALAVPSTGTTASNQSLTDIQSSVPSGSTLGTPSSFTYNTSTPLRPVSGNFVNIPTATQITVYVWTVDPTTSMTTPSAVASIFNTGGQLVAGGTTTTSDNNAGYIIQNVGTTDSNMRNIFYVYNKRPLTVVNNSTATITVQTVARNSRLISVTGTGSYVFPSSTTPTDIASAVQSIVSSTGSNSANFTPAFPSELYTGAYVWSGASPAVGASADYAVSFRPVDYAQLRSATASPPSLTGSFSSSTNTLTITNSSTPTPGTRQIGESCSANTDCTTNNCVSGICRPVGFTPSNHNDDGWPWWAWMLLIIGAILVIGLIIFMVVKSQSGGDKSAEAPATTTHTTVIEHHPPN